MERVMVTSENVSHIYTLERRDERCYLVWASYTVANKLCANLKGSASAC